MIPLRTDLSVFRKFNFEYAPVGIKYLISKPEGMEQLDKTMALCEMVSEVQQRGTPFYITKDNENCGGRMTLGMEDPSPIAESGQVGMKYGIFQEPRANGKMNQQAPRNPTGTVNYAVFATMDKLTFEPDLMIFIATFSQAEIMLRAASYSTGEIWTSKVSMVGACAWLFTYPYQSGNINYVPTGMTFGMKVRKIYPEGLISLSIPYNWIPIIAENLNQMEWVLPSYTDTREEFLARSEKVMMELAQEFMNP
jgi:uncharacterized protein (DUF169 family)